jgi:hypothetical protein
VTGAPTPALPRTGRESARLKVSKAVALEAEFPLPSTGGGQGEGKLGSVNGWVQDPAIVNAD